ncbi:MAG TPA: HEAT repeat domain-containing protein [Myxococcales bacterium]|nr:HEAT repeat domain-containing protein [Myxococcales bacterium]
MGFFSSLFGKREPEPAPPADDPADAIDSEDGAERVDALRELVERWRSGDAQAAELIAPRLPDLLEDPEPLVRAAALSALRLLQNPENLQKCESAVLALLADPAPRVRTAAIWAAMRIPGEAARTQVRAALGSTEESMRFAAACALAEARDSAALPELLAALRDDHRRQEAISALMALGDAAAVPELEKLLEEEPVGDFDRTLTAAALARFGDARGIAHLISRIEMDGDDRPVATEWAGRLGVHDAIPVLSELAETEGAVARGAAMRALGRLKAVGAEERLLRIAGDPGAPEDLRMDAAEGLAELGTPAALDHLRQLSAEGPEELKQLCQELLVEVQANAG